MGSEGAGAATVQLLGGGHPADVAFALGGPPRSRPARRLLTDGQGHPGRGEGTGAEPGAAGEAPSADRPPPISAGRGRPGPAGDSVPPSGNPLPRNFAPRPPPPRAGSALWMVCGGVGTPPASPGPQNPATCFTGCQGQTLGSALPAPGHSCRWLHSSFLHQILFAPPGTGGAGPGCPQRPARPGQACGDPEPEPRGLYWPPAQAARPP